jgi:hypothetical protein
MFANSTDLAVVLLLRSIVETAFLDLLLTVADIVPIVLA